MESDFPVYMIEKTTVRSMCGGQRESLTVGGVCRIIQNHCGARRTEGKLYGAGRFACTFSWCSA